MTSSTRFQEAKRLNPLVEILAEDGLELRKSGRSLMARCPLPGHEDGTPSFSVRVSGDTQLFKCFGCGRAGDVVSYVQFRHNLDAARACDWLMRRAHDHGLAARCSPLIRRASELETPASAPDAAPLLRDVAAFYQQGLEDTPAALEYLRRRGLGDPEILHRFRIGYAAGTLRDTLGSDGAQAARLAEIGILGPKGQEQFLGCITVPIVDLAGAVVGMYGRSIEGTKHRYLRGPHRGVLNGEAAKVYPDGLMLTEAIFDMLSIYRAGFPNVIPCYGTSGFTELHALLLREHRVKRVILAFDRDDPGTQGAQRVAERLVPMGIEALRLHWPAEMPGKDANDFFRWEGGAREAFEKLVAEAKPLATAKAQIPVATVEPATANTAGGEFEHLVSVNDEEAVFAFPDVLYTLRGIDRISRDAMRLVLAAEAHGKTHTDRFDLYVARSRRSFAAALQARLDLPMVRVEEDLLAMTATLEDLHRRRVAELAQASGKTVIAMSADEERAARELLAARDLLSRVREAYDVLGYVGEPRTKTLAFLVGCSRRLDQPLSLILRSSSAAGKSGLLEKTVELMPPEEVEYLSRLTPAAIWYMDPTHLRHKVLVIDERAGSAEADYSLRSLQSQKKLTLAVPLKDARGMLRTHQKTVYGPTAIMESTTEETINPENANRCFEAYLDESAEQTQRIHEAQRNHWAHAGRNGEAKRASVVRLFQNAQRLLKAIVVQIPFAHAIDFPREWIRTRRDQDRFLSLAAASAFLHQAQRPVVPGEPPAIAATVEDYRVAYDLARDLLHSALADLPAPAARMLEAIRRNVRRLAKEQGIDADDIAFRRRDVRAWTCLPDHHVKRTMRVLEDLEHVETLRAGRGCSHRYRLLDEGPVRQAFEALTTPDQLEERLRAPVAASAGV